MTCGDYPLKFHRTVASMLRRRCSKLGVVSKQMRRFAAFLLCVVAPMACNSVPPPTPPEITIKVDDQLTGNSMFSAEVSCTAPCRIRYAIDGGEYQNGDPPLWALRTKLAPGPHQLVVQAVGGNDPWTAEYIAERRHSWHASDVPQLRPDSISIWQVYPSSPTSFRFGACARPINGKLLCWGYPIDRGRWPVRQTLVGTGDRGIR